MRSLSLNTYHGNMAHPLYNPATAFGNKALLRACPPVEEREEGEEEEPEKERVTWNAEATEYTLDWRCPCGAKNEDTFDTEPCSDDEVGCYRCNKTFILE